MIIEKVEQTVTFLCFGKLPGHTCMFLSKSCRLQGCFEAIQLKYVSSKALFILSRYLARFILIYLGRFSWSQPSSPGNVSLF